MSYRGFPIYTQSQDLCDVTQCPVEKGPLTVKLEEPFPIITPPVRETAAAPAGSTWVARSLRLCACRGARRARTLCACRRWAPTPPRRSFASTSTSQLYLRQGAGWQSR